MAVVRSTETRLLEGIRRDFLADADVAAYFGTNVIVGPLVSDDIYINPPQINLSLAPSEVYDFGMSGQTKDRVSVVVRAYFQITDQAVGFAVGGLNPHDYVKHLQLIIINGSTDPLAANAVNGNGYVRDPDWVQGVGPDAFRWLNRAMYGCTKQIAIPTKGDGALLIPFFIDYELAVDPRTGQRN